MIKKGFFLGFITISLFFQCQKTPASKKDGEKSNPENSPEQKVKSQNPLKTTTYKEPNIPEFFNQLVDNHRAHFQQIDSQYRQLSSRHNVSPGDSASIDRYYTLFILQKLFTANGPNNYSTGPILDIPYLWHWTEPNPRKQIRLSKTSKKLKNIEPPENYSQYNSYAMIDRTPFLYLKDLLAAQPKYLAPDRKMNTDTFATFGWCSERAMAYVCLLEMLGFEGSVVVSGIHSWSEFIVLMKSNNGETIPFRVEVDNTYHTMKWKKVDNKQHELNRWDRLEEKAKRGEWYNRKAHSRDIKQQPADSKVPEEATQRIEGKVVAYLKERLKKKR